MLSADYSQIELRILAHVAKDPILIEAFKKDEDIHARTACEVFGCPAESVNDELRRQAKVINFGIIYGMSAFGLSRSLGISNKMAQAFIDHYFERYSGVKAYVDDTIERARQTCRTSTLLGRLRLLPDIASPNPTVRQFAERTAINTPIQGTAADLIKLAMIAVDRWIRDSGNRCRMIMQVHDELVLEVPQDQLQGASDRLRELMSGVARLAVPLVVDVGHGANWDEAH